MKPENKRSFAIVMVALACLAGCTTPLDRWETSMRVYAASNNTVAVALDEGRIKVEEAKTYRDMARVVRAALDGWLLTISPDGSSDDGAARSAAYSAMAEIRSWLARTLTKQ